MGRIRQRIRAINALPPEVLDDAAMRYHLLSSTNSYLGMFRRTRSCRLRTRLFNPYLLFRAGYAEVWMRKFVMFRDTPYLALKSYKMKKLWKTLK